MVRSLSALLLLVIPIAVPAASPDPVLEMSADGEVQIAPDGHVADYRLTDVLAPAIAELVDRDVRKWMFQPVLVDGVPVVAKTRMTLRLRGEPNGSGAEQFRVRIIDASFKQAWISVRVPNRKRTNTVASSNAPVSQPYAAGIST